MTLMGGDRDMSGYWNEYGTMVISRNTGIERHLLSRVGTWVVTCKDILGCAALQGFLPLPLSIPVLFIKVQATPIGAALFHYPS